MTTSETRQAKKGLPFKDITVEPGDTFWPRMERLMVKYDIDTANVEYASLRETSDQEWASKLYVQYGIGGRFSGIEARVDAGPFFGDLATPPAADRGLVEALEFVRDCESTTPWPELRTMAAKALAAHSTAPATEDKGVEHLAFYIRDNARLREALVECARNDGSEHFAGVARDAIEYVEAPAPATPSNATPTKEDADAREHDAIPGTDRRAEGEDGRGSQRLHGADEDAGGAAQEPLPVVGAHDAGGERDVGEQGDHAGQRRDAARGGQGRVAGASARVPHSPEAVAQREPEADDYASAEAEWSKLPHVCGTLSPTTGVALRFGDRWGWGRGAGWGSGSSED